MAKTEKPSAIATANEQLTALQVRQEELTRLVADLDRTEPVVRADIDRAQRDATRASANGVFDVPETVAARLKDCQRRLADLIERRDAARQELAGLPARRVEAIREHLRPAWSEYVAAKKRSMDEGFTLAVRVEGLVADYNRSASRYEESKAGIDRIGKVLGVHLERVLGDLRREVPEPQQPAGVVEREALYRAGKLRELFRQRPA